MDVYAVDVIWEWGEMFCGFGTQCERIIFLDRFILPYTVVPDEFQAN